MDDEMVLLAAAMKMAIAEQEEAEAAKETFLKQLKVSTVLEEVD